MRPSYHPSWRWTKSALPGGLAALSLALLAPPVGCGGASGQGQTGGPKASLKIDTSGASDPYEGPAGKKPGAHKFAVASENEAAARVAMEVLRKGGSAADAAIACSLANGVAQPVSSGLGGGGFAMIYEAKTGKVTVLDYRETAPAGLNSLDYARRPPPESRRGVMTGVPGEVAGLAEIHARFGKLGFADVVRGAAELAEKGFPVTEHMARTLKWNERWVLTGGRTLFAPLGKLLGVGDRAQNEALAATLKRIGAEGKAAFYEGAIATDVVSTARSAGSRMTLQDLRRYQVKEREPIKVGWEGYEVYTMPTPSAGGIMLAETLVMHSKQDLLNLSEAVVEKPPQRIDVFEAQPAVTVQKPTGAYLHLLAETFRGAVADRYKLVGDPDFVQFDWAELWSPERMKERREKISLDQTTPPEKFDVREAGTSHMVVVDGEGNVVSLTSSINNMFGAKLVTRGGFILNDELDDFTLGPTAVRYGVHVVGPNAPRPNARPVSSMMPTIVTKGGAPVVALGGSGGARISTGVTQVLLQHLALGRTITDAVAAPRIDTPALGGLLIEQGISQGITDDLLRRGEVPDSGKINYSAVVAVSLGEQEGLRHLEATGDSRKGGVGLVE